MLIIQKMLEALTGKKMLNMSREFASQMNISIRAGDAKIDPLVINLNGESPGLKADKKNGYFFEGRQFCRGNKPYRFGCLGGSPLTCCRNNIQIYPLLIGG